MKTTDKLRSLGWYALALVILGALFFPSCDPDELNLEADISSYDSVSFITKNGRFERFLIDSVYPADIVLGISPQNDTIRFVKGVNPKSYYFIVPTRMPTGTHTIVVPSIRTRVKVTINSLTAYNGTPNEYVLGDYVGNEVAPYISYFRRSNPTLFSALNDLQVIAVNGFNALAGTEKTEVAIIMAANPDMFKTFNDQVAELASSPLSGPSGVSTCKGTTFLSYFPCVFGQLDQSLLKLDGAVDRFVAFNRAIAAAFYNVTPQGNFVFNVKPSTKTIPVMLFFMQLLPRSSVMTDIAKQANEKAWIFEADFSGLSANYNFARGVGQTLPVSARYRNIRNGDANDPVLGPMIGTYITRYNVFRDFWNNSLLAAYAGPIPGISPVVDPIPLSSFATAASISTSEGVGVTTNTVDVSDSGFFASFSMNPIITQTFKLNFTLKNQGFERRHSVNATVVP